LLLASSDFPAQRSAPVKCFSAALLLAALTMGCAEVRPWERGVLAHPSMDPESKHRACADEFLRHTFDVRELATGGAGQAGGGCGCN